LTVPEPAVKGLVEAQLKSEAKKKELDNPEESWERSLLKEEPNRSIQLEAKIEIGVMVTFEGGAKPICTFLALICPY
jgi:hypothetical protein